MSATFPIPDTALDGRLGIVGLTGSGKTNAAKCGVERLLELGRRVCIVDLLDGWWGLRLGRDGKKAAYPVAIFGGRHGDMPINEHAGAVVGQAVAQSHESVIVSLSEIDTDEARRRFARAFFDALHRFNRAPINLVIDEADFYAPQQPLKESNASFVLNRVKEIAARGRMRGFRAWVITQRPAKLHKDVLSQCDTLVAMQLTASQDRDAIDGWIGDQADRKTGKEILATLPRLQRGQGVVWSPRLGILEPRFFPLSATYDSGRTPDFDEEVADVTLAPLDLGALKEKLASVEIEAKENDPKTLKAEIAKLRRQVETAPEAAPVDTEELDRLRIDNDELAKLLDDMEKERDGLKADLETERAGAEELRTRLSEIGKLAGVVTPIAEPRYQQVPSGTSWRDRRPQSAPARAPRQPTAAARPPADGLTGPQQRILDALAWWESVGVGAPNRTQVAAVAAYSPSGSAFTNPLGALRSVGLVDYPSAGTVSLSREGRRRANRPQETPTTADLHDKIVAILDGPKERILRPLLRSYPRQLTREALAQAAGYSPDGSAFTNPLGALRSLGLIDYPSPGHVKAEPILFLESAG